MKKTLYLMRHGETLFNVRRKKQGWCDSPLTPKGIEQAKHARSYFEQQGITFDHAYSSTSERACDTLELITAQPYVRMKGLKEWNFGSFEGESEDLNPPLPYRDFFVLYGGEEEKAFQKRIVTTLTEIMETKDAECVLVVSHGAACAQFMRYWQHNSELKQTSRIVNCGIMKYSYENGEFTLEEIIDPHQLSFA